MMVQATARAGGKRSTSSQPRATRRRRTGAEARRAILEAARRRLAEGGPEAIRLQEIARDVGVSHPAILHHFESREGLMKALALSAVEALDVELMQAIGDPRGQTTPDDVLERVFEALQKRGLARLLGWYALSHFTPGPKQEQLILRNLAAVLQERLEREPGVERPTPDEAAHVIRLGAVAMLGDAIFGHLIDLSLGVKDDAEAQTRFRTWLAKLVSQRLGLDPPA